MKNLAKRVYYIPNKIKPLNFKKIMNDVAKYSYNKVIMMAYNKAPLKYVEYYNLDNEKNIIEQFSYKYLVIISSKNFKNKVFKNINLCLVEDKNINVICNLDQEINAEGIENIKNILDNKLKYYKN